MNAPVTPLREGFVEARAPAAEAPAPEQPPVARPAPQPAAKPDLPKAVPPPQLEAPPTPISDEDEWPLIVKLMHGTIVNDKGETLSAVSFRKPRAGDINRYGNPTRVNRDGDIVIDEVKMTYVMAALSGILPPFIEAMDTRDWNSCAYKLRGFFLPDLRAL